MFIPKAGFETIFQWSSGYLNSLYPGVIFDGTFHDFADTFSMTELSNNPTFSTLAPAAQSAVIDEAVKELSASVTQATGVAPLPSESMSDVAYAYVTGTFAHWKNQFKGQFTIVWVIALFLIFRTAGFVFIWVAQFISLLVYEALLALGFMHVDGVPQTKEFVRY